MMLSCGSSSQKEVVTNKDSINNCIAVPNRFAAQSSFNLKTSGDSSFEGMVLIPGGIFEMGGDNEKASADEFPKHEVLVDSFYMYATKVTNQQFQIFVEAIGYITTAERKPDWEELKKHYRPAHPSCLILYW